MASPGGQDKPFWYIKDIDDEELIRRVQLTEKNDEPTPFYFEPQKILGELIIERIRLMLHHYREQEQGNASHGDMAECQKLPLFFGQWPQISYFMPCFLIFSNVKIKGSASAGTQFLFQKMICNCHSRITS